MIVVYDVGEKRVTRVLKTCRKYLNWVQNSVLEGEISETNVKKLKAELSKIIDDHEDSVIYLANTKIFESGNHGIGKGRTKHYYLTK